jgi:leader peptidase (prepilin peptidase)/N-methyltransferase
MNLALSLLLSEPLADVPLLLVAVLVGVMGTFVGSFLNVVIHRVPQEDREDRDIVFKPSHCPVCLATIKPYDNIPLVSYALLGGRCRSCRTRISPRYAVVEALTGLLWLLVFWHHLSSRGALTWVFPFDIILVTALVALIFIDAEHMILPNAITYPGMIFALLARLALPFLVGVSAFEDVAWLSSLSAFRGWPPVALSLFGAVLGGLAGGGSLWFLGWLWKTLRGVEAMGLGDVKMMLAVGAYLGWRMTLVTLFLSAITGSLIGLALMFKRGERNMQMLLPFGIFLGLGSIISLLTGPPLLHWYLSSFR